MQRFILEQNIAHFEKLLGGAVEPSLRRTLQTLLLSTQRQLAILESTSAGAELLPSRLVRRKPKRPELIGQVYPEFDGSPHPYLVLDPGPGLLIVDINDAYARATLTARDAVAGRSLFEVFPDNPDDPLADGVRNLYASLRAVAQTGRPNAMEIQRYDVRDPDGCFVEKYWQPLNTPIHDADGHLMYILHHVEDVTADMPSLRSGPGAPAASCHPSPDAAEPNG